MLFYLSLNIFPGPQVACLPTLLLSHLSIYPPVSESCPVIHYSLLSQLPHGHLFNIFHLPSWPPPLFSLCNSVLVTYWTGFLKLMQSLLVHLSKDSQSLLLLHLLHSEKRSGEGDKCNVIPVTFNDFYFFFVLATLYLYSFKCANLEKPLLFSCIGGYKYLYMGNLSRQVRCTLGWSRVTVSAVHLFKWACKKMNIPPRSIMFSSNYTCSVTHSTSDCLFPVHDLKQLVYIWCFRSKWHFLHSCESWYKRVTDIRAARVCTLYVCEMQSEQLTSEAEQ